MLSHLKGLTVVSFRGYPVIPTLWLPQFPVLHLILSFSPLLSSLCRTCSHKPLALLNQWLLPQIHLAQVTEFCHHHSPLWHDRPVHKVMTHMPYLQVHQGLGTRGAPHRLRIPSVGHRSPPNIRCFLATDQDYHRHLPDPPPLLCPYSNLR